MGSSLIYCWICKERVHEKCSDIQRKLIAHGKDSSLWYILQEVQNGKGRGTGGGYGNRGYGGQMETVGNEEL